MTVTRRHLVVSGGALGCAALFGGLLRRAGAGTIRKPEPMPAASLYGKPRYGPGFAHFDYVNPAAPKGGGIISEASGSFDSLNRWSVKGRKAAGLYLISEPLMVQSLDETFSLYGLVAEGITIPDDRSWVAFTLHPDARWHDGRPITADDVIWTFNVLVSGNIPFYRNYYAGVASVERTGDREVTFSLKPGDNRELPLILAQMEVLPGHYWETRDTSVTSLDRPLGSGPYFIDDMEPGQFISYRRVDGHWSTDLPVNRGRWNFETIRFEYYRDRDVATEAFKAGEFDLRSENSARRWHTQYDFPAMNAGHVVKARIAHEIPRGMQGFFFNTRREIFADPRVRQALAHAFDFEWTNKTLMYGEYARTNSYFTNSELSSEHALPDPGELAVLEPYRGRIPDQVFDTLYRPPATDGSGNIRRNLRNALALLREAGWTIDSNGRLADADGTPFEFELLLVQPSLETIALPFKDNLDRLGITMTVRRVDGSEYVFRLRQFDFDMIVHSIGQSSSPGNEQRNYWHSASAELPGSFNVAGIRDTAIDELVELVISAPDHEQLVARTRALDRVLLWGHYVIPHFHTGDHRLVYWNRFGRPAVTPKFSLGYPSTWWIDRERDDRVEAWRKGI